MTKTCENSGRYFFEVSNRRTSITKRTNERTNVYLQDLKVAESRLESFLTREKLLRSGSSSWQKSSENTKIDHKIFAKILK